MGLNATVLHSFLLDMRVTCKFPVAKFDSPEVVRGVACFSCFGSRS